MLGKGGGGAERGKVISQGHGPNSCADNTDVMNEANKDISVLKTNLFLKQKLQLLSNYKAPESHKAKKKKQTNKFSCDSVFFSVNSCSFGWGH